MAGSVIGAVAGGVANSIFGGDEPQAGAGGVQQVHNTSEVLIPDYLKSVIYKGDNSLVKRANRLSLESFAPYTDPRYAGFNADQLAAFQGVRDNFGRWSGDFEDALNMNRAAYDRVQNGFVNDNTLAKYMNPYQQQVTDIAKREALRDFDKQMNVLNDSFAKTAAFGGDRQAVSEMEAYRDINQRLDDLQVQGLHSNFTNAIQTALNAGAAETAAMGNAATNQANLAGASQNASFADLAGLQQIGGQQQALSQANLDFDYGQFKEEQNWEQQRLNSLAGLVYPLLGQSSTGSQTNTTTTPGLSTGNAILGGAALGNSIFGRGGLNSVFSPTSTINWNQGGTSTYSNPNFLGGLLNFKEGGMVKGNSLKEYAEGGKVDTGETFYKFLEGTYPAMWQEARNASRRNRSQEGSRLERALMGLAEMVAPQSILIDSMGKTGELTRGLTDYLLENPKKSKEKSGQIKNDREKYELENNILGLYDFDKYGSSINWDLLEKTASTPEEKQAAKALKVHAMQKHPEWFQDKSPENALRQKMNKISEELGVNPVFEETTKIPEKPLEETPKETSEDLPVIRPAAGSPILPLESSSKESPKGNLLSNILDKAHVPSLGAAATILQSGNKPVLSSLGGGLDRYISENKEISKSRLFEKQNEFENLIRMMNANNLSRQNEISNRRLSMEEEMLPFKQGKEALEMKKLQREAQEDPFIAQAIDIYMKENQGIPANLRDDDFETAVRSKAETLRRLSKIQGSSEDTSLGNPLGLSSVN